MLERISISNFNGIKIKVMSKNEQILKVKVTKNNIASFV